MERLKKISDRLFSTSAAGAYLILFAAAIGYATFIENDYGTTAAQKLIYRAKWFELLLVLFGICIIVNIFRFRMIQQRKWSTLLFHAAIIVIILGAGVTRYFGSEGMMHIREGSETNLILSTETYLQFEVESHGKNYAFDEKVLFASRGKNRFKENYKIGDKIIDIHLEDFIPNPVEHMVPHEGGTAMVKLVMAGSGGRQEYILKEGDKVTINNLAFNFTDIEDPEAINILVQNDSLKFISNIPLSQMEMVSQRVDTLISDKVQPMLVRSLYSTGQHNFVISEFLSNAKVNVSSGSYKMESGSQGLARLKIKSGSDEKYVDAKGGMGMTGKAESTEVNGMNLRVAYGAKYLQLPFSIRLKDFIMERYPGTNSASSYASEVTLIDSRDNVNKDHRIFMNNILSYGGYRFFQSSFDPDEKGTVLSVNHDAPGTWLSYLGYFLLTLGMVVTLVNKKSRFYSLSKKLKEMQANHKVLTLIFLLFFSFNSKVLADGPHPSLIVDADHAAAFSELTVQDFRGRMKPFHTLAGEVLRKLSRKESLYDQTPSQIYLGMMVYPNEWADVPLIYTGRNPELKELIGSEDKLAKYNDFFKPEYVLRDQVQAAHSKEAKDRGTFEKEIIRIDERINICNMIFSGQLLRLFPNAYVQTDQWQSLAELSNPREGEASSDDPLRQIFPAYASSVRGSDWKMANELVDGIKEYQKKLSAELLPSESKISAEITLNKMNVFSRIGRAYGLLGLFILGMFFFLVFKPNIDSRWPLYLAVGLLGLCFLVHTAGLGLRWYVSGRAPWSNGYESMIYIAWTTMLAGMIFTRRSLGGLAATAVLSSTILMVAGLSWMDPEITPLVPVLKSYWLTIHVSLEAGSYGFLMLGAIIGILNLILMIFISGKNKDRLNSKIKELTYISEMTLIAGLIMISIGTYLGGIWANESWGRYWGWDAKETWALVTILIYAFILHMRFIPGLRGAYAFNVASLFGLASVMMTYFGVNYYLSGLHSYAAGDPAPIPSYVYYAVFILVGVSLLAYWRRRVVG